MLSGSRVTLITGITGFLGGATAARLLAQGEKIVALVRATERDQAQARVAASIARFGVQLRSSDVNIVLGDIAEMSTYDALDLSTVTHALHAAGCTSFRSRREVARTNVVGTSFLAHALLKAPLLERFVHVSTAYCCGASPAAKVHEVDSPRAGHRHVTEYARSKAEGELSLSEMPWQGRLVVARPSVVIGDGRFGVAPSASLFWYYRALAHLGRGPFSLSETRDVVPVDYVAEALCFLLNAKSLRHGAYHVSAGARSCTVKSILERLTGRAFGDSDWRKVSGADLDRNAAVDLRSLTRTDEEASKLRDGVVACAKFGALGVQWFDNSRILDEGMPAPIRFVDYLSLCAAGSVDSSVYDQMVDDV